MRLQIRPRGSNVRKQTDVGGTGDHALEAGPEGEHVYSCDVAVLAPPPMEKPLLQVTLMLCPVVPVREVVTLLDTEKGAQLTAAW